MRGDSLSDSIAIRNRLDELNVSPRLDSYSKVVVHVSDEVAYEYPSGDVTSGLVLDVDNPFGTPQMAKDLYERLSGYQYQPYDATGAHLDPTAEIGDALNASTVHGGIYKRNRKFGRLMKADVSAPMEEELDHEYQYVSATEREFRREFGEVRATLSIQNDKIDAKVEADTSGNKQTFGWKLTSSSWEGLEVNGKITATSGMIGGFNIGSRAIYNNLSSFGGTQTSGVYLGTDGIQLGQNFKVTTSGTVTASSLKLKGTITFLNSDGTSAGTLSAANLRKYANDAYTSACTSGGYCYGGAAGGYNWNDAKDGKVWASFLKTTALQCGQISINGMICAPYSATINGVTIPYWGYGAPH